MKKNMRARFFTCDKGKISSAKQLWQLGKQRMRRRMQIVRFYAAQKRAMLRSERGAVTVEYAILITAAAAIAGALVLIANSPEIRAILTDIIHKAIQGSAS